MGILASAADERVKNVEITDDALVIEGMDGVAAQAMDDLLKD